MKIIIKPVIIFCIVILVPFILISCLFGFNFNMINWEEPYWLFYIFQIVILGCFVGYTLDTNKK